MLTSRSLAPWIAYKAYKSNIIPPAMVISKEVHDFPFNQHLIFLYVEPSDDSAKSAMLLALLDCYKLH